MNFNIFNRHISDHQRILEKITTPFWFLTLCLQSSHCSNVPLVRTHRGIWGLGTTLLFPSQGAEIVLVCQTLLIWGLGSKFSHLSWLLIILPTWKVTEREGATTSVSGARILKNIQLKSSVLIVLLFWLFCFLNYFILFLLKVNSTTRFIMKKGCSYPVPSHLSFHHHLAHSLNTFSSFLWSSQFHHSFSKNQYLEFLLPYFLISKSHFLFSECHTYTD